MLRTLTRRFWSGGYNSSSPKLLNAPDVMSDGSSNVLVTGTGKNDAFKGITIKGGVTGSKVLMNAGDGYGGLGAYNETGVGSVFKVLGALFYIGAGTLYWNGTSATDSASTTLSIKKFTSGALGTAYQAGMAQPSAPIITAVTPPSGYTGKNNGVVTVKIARVRSQTGARSIASLTSNSVQATNQSVAITFPSADANGQDYWEIDVTKNGEGGIGNHFFLQEVPESTIAGSVTASRIATNTTSIGVPNGTLTAAHIGWQYTSSGDTTTYVTAVGANDSYSAGNQAITLNAANGSTNTQSATFTRGISGSTRTYVVEWQDADLVGSDLAPTRDYPPPAAIFGGVSEDVVFVDGAYGDTVSLPDRTSNTTTSSIGNAIAVSDPARPESFPPDNYLFCGDGPTCLLPGGDGIHWRFAQNSLGVIRYVGGSPALSYQRLWYGIGVQKQTNAVLGSGGRLYCYTGARGITRLGVNGEPDTAFGSPILEDVKSWTPSNVVLGYDANHQYVLYMHGTTILAFYEPLEIWCAPITITGLGSKVIKSAVTINGAVYLAYGDGSSIDLYDFNVGSGGTAIVRSPWIRSEAVSDVISRILATIRADNIANDVVVKIYKNGSTTPAVTQNVTLTASGFQALPILKPNVRQAKLYRIEFTLVSTGGDAGFEDYELLGESQAISF